MEITSPERISNLKQYINKYNWEGIDFPVKRKEWKKIEQNNKTIALNVLYIPRNTKIISVAYRSEYNNKRKTQVILLMITNGKIWHYLAISNLSALLRGNSSSHYGNLYCLNCFNSYTTKNKLKQHEEICNNHNSCLIEMPKWVEKILKYNPGGKSLKAPFAIYLNLECLLKKEQSCENNNNNNNIKESYTEKRPNVSLMCTRCSFDEKENKLNYYRGKYCIGKLCKS